MKCLFIGGSLGGKVIETNVPKPMIDPETRDFYNCHRFVIGDKVMQVYVWETVPLNDAIRELEIIEGLRP